MTIDQIQSLPLFEIEYSFQSLKEFFFSMYYDDKSYHTRLHVEDRAIKCQSEDQVPLEFAMKGNDLQVAFDGKITTISPVDKINIGFKVTSLAVSHDGTWIVIGGENGKLGIYNSQLALQVECIGHKSDITMTKFFPSGQVVLSGSIDMSLKVWGMDGSNPVTLIGHTRAITDAEMVDRGRLILSSSLDGTVKLWHIASSSVLHTFCPTENSGVTSIKLLDCPWLNSSNELKDGPELDLTRNKLLVVGTVAGIIYGFNLFNRSLLFTASGPDNVRITSLDCSLEYKSIWAGLENGILVVFSLNEDFKVCMKSLYRRSKSPLFVSHVPFKNSPCLWLSSSDGSCALWSFENNQILKELGVSSTQSACVYAFGEEVLVCSGSSGILYMEKEK